MKIDPKQFLEIILTNKFKNKLEKEYKFMEKRKFRFDFAIPEIKLAIEYEGIMSAKARHTSITGYSKDCEKYNLAMCDGWRVLRFTALNFQEIETYLEFL